MGTQIKEDTYHIGVIRSSLNRNLGLILPDAVDELDVAFKDELDSKLNPAGWTPLKVIDLFTRVVARTSNRVFVGLPVCEFCAATHLSLYRTLNSDP